MTESQSVSINFQLLFCCNIGNPLPKEVVRTGRNPKGDFYTIYVDGSYEYENMIQARTVSYYCELYVNGQPAHIFNWAVDQNSGYYHPKNAGVPWIRFESQEELEQAFVSLQLKLLQSCSYITSERNTN